MIAVAGGTLIEKLHLESEVEEFIRNGKSIDTPQNELTKRDRLKYSWEQVTGTVKKVVPYVIVGVGIGAVIHNWIPEEWVIKLLGTGNPFGVIIATICGIPMYAPHCRSTRRKGRKTRRCSCIYDGRYHAVAAVDDHAEKSDQTEAAWHIHCYMFSRNYPCGIFLQYHSKLYHLGGIDHVTVWKEKRRSKS